VTATKIWAGRSTYLARAIEQGAVLACPGIGLVTLAQVRVLDGILDVVIVAQVRADLLKTTNSMREKGKCMQWVLQEDHEP
jgi:hypothetical protein